MKPGILSDKSEDFALRIVKLYSFLTDTKHEFIMSKQLLRSGTSIGANVAESVYAQTSPDFITKLTIALKEANETKYWLSLLKRSGYVTQDMIKDLESDCIGLIKMLTSSINTVRQKCEQ